MSTPKKNNTFMIKLATFIVDKRSLFFLLYACAIIFSLFAMSWVKVEDDVTTYLPKHTETRQGIEAMNSSFAAIASARIMIRNVTYDTALELYDAVSVVDGVAMVTFDNTPAHYVDATALLEVTFADGPMDSRTLNALDQIRQLLQGYDLHIDTTVGQDANAMLAEEMAVILVVGVAIMLTVLTLTSRSYMEIPVLVLAFGAAAIINMGTNFIFGTISFISDSVAVVLQLALAIDYAIILCHRFSDEHETKPPREACIDALVKAIPEISASSLTTISGLIALGFMEFGVGLDMAQVLIKSILLSLMAVFTLMPGLLMLFSPLIDKTRHKKLLPSVSFIGKFAVKTRRILPPLFLLTLVGAFFLSSNCPYCYSFTDLKTAKMTEQQHAYFAIKDTFGTSNMVAVLVPSGDYRAEAAVLSELEHMEEVKGTMGLSGIEAMNGYTLTESLNPRELSELMEMDYEVIQALYAVYATEHNQLGQIVSGLDNYEIPLFDMFLYIKGQMDANNLNLAGEDGAMMQDMFAQLNMAKNQMQSERYSRLVVYLNLPEEGAETYAFLDTIREVLGKYYDGDYYVVGNSTSSRDLASAFASDNLMISLLSAFFVILVLLFTFQSAGLPLLLIIVIQGSIWINFSFPYLMDQPLYFLGYLIVNAIQMGANIDYAIVISSHYQEKKAYLPHKQAIVEAINAAFPTVFTSGTIMASAGLLIGGMSAQPVVSIMGTCIGRGTIISIILVLFVLPSILVLGDSIIERTRFKFNVKGIQMPVKKAVGAVRIQGHIRGQVSGYVDAAFDGVLRGQLDAVVSTGTQIEPAEEVEGGADHE